MVKFYISWCPGIGECDRALEYVKNSKVIDGIEGSYDSIEFYKISELGIKYSYHNPTFRKNYKNINEVGYIEDFENNKILRDGIKISSPSVIGLHAPLDESEFPQFEKNLKFLQSKTDKEFLIEPRPFWLRKDFEFKKGFDRSWIKKYLLDDFKVKISTIDFLDNFLDKNHLGMLLDISHTRITMMYMIEGGFYEGTLDEFFIEWVKRFGDRIKQIHINHSKFADGVFLDSHSMLTEGCEALRILKLVYPYLNNVEFINLEVNTGFEPFEHVKELEREIELVKYSL
jgi:hypothetical protein